jgi:hypothetical protein
LGKPVEGVNIIAVSRPPKNREEIVQGCARGVRPGVIDSIVSPNSTRALRDVGNREILDAIAKAAMGRR